MTYDSRPWTNRARDLARSQMELVQNIHLVHLAIVSGRSTMHRLEFEDADYAGMIGQTLPALVRDAGAIGAIVSSPARNARREGVIVALMERTIEMFYVPIVRSINADVLIGEFRTLSPVSSVRYAALLEALVANWLKGDNA
jgi:hypothetical protein